MYKSNETLISKTTSNIDYDSNTMLPALNPYILTACPRPGGFFKILQPSHSNLHVSNQSNNSKIIIVQSKSSMCSKKSSKQSTQQFINDTITFNENVKKKNEYNLKLNKDNEAKLKEEKKSEDVQTIFSDKMLPVTISCVMLMAANVEKIDEEYFTCAETYLSAIKDNKGQYPQNIKGILKHIRCLKKINGEVELRPQPPAPPAVVITHPAREENKNLDIDETCSQINDSKLNLEMSTPSKQVNTISKIPIRKTVAKPQLL